MGWKDWPYWLKGGSIGVTLTLIYMLLGLIGALAGDSWAGLAIIVGIVVIIPVFLITAIIGSVVGIIKGEKTGNFNGKSSLVFGIISVITAILSPVFPSYIVIFPILSGILGLTTSIVQRKIYYNSYAKWGFILSIIGMIIFVAILTVAIFTIRSGSGLTVVG